MIGAIIQGADHTTMDLDLVMDINKDVLKNIAGFFDKLHFTTTSNLGSNEGIEKAIENSKKGTQIVFYDPYSSVKVEILWEIDGFTHADALARGKEFIWEDIKVIALDIRDIAKSKKIANRPKDRAVMDRLEEVIRESDSIAERLDTDNLSDYEKPG